MTKTGATRPRFAAFAPTDCHTCLSRQRQCDKQRPYCSTCLDEGLKCGGYATSLLWHQCRAYSGKQSRWHGQHSASPRPAVDLHKPQARSPPVATRTFRFVERRNRRARQPRKDTSTQPTTPINPQELEPLEVASLSIDQDTGFSATIDIDSFLDNFQPEIHLRDERGEGSDPSVPASETGQTWSALENESCPVSNHIIDPDAVSFGITSVQPASPGLSPCSMTFGPDGFLTFKWPDLGCNDRQDPPDSLSVATDMSANQQQEILLKHYDTDLCVLPLTSDMRLNPFRIRGFGREDSQLLLHSISALSSQHQVNLGKTQSSEASHKRSQAYSMLSDALQSGQLGTQDSSLLAAILILMTLDCTISALGNWSEHIRRAVTVFEAWGGPSALNTPRLRSQASMLVWWDATLAMMSRQGTKLSSAYFRHLVQHEKTDRWSFYELTGCPTELLILLVRLAEMAHAKEMAESMECLTFDVKSVLDIERQLLEWNSGYGEDQRHFLEQIIGQGDESEPGNGGTNKTRTAEDEMDEQEDYRRQQDDYHCSEAWRYALLLYIQRVFRWDRGSHQRPAAILPLVCKIFEHCRNCRKTSQVQKQLLLPVFLAGAEARDKDLQDTARAYCLWWGARSRYGMFYSVSCLLEEFWALESSKDGHPRWWGSFLNAKSSSGKAEDLAAMQFLFG
ncbi:hypothetical protein PV04_05168 [Phialophora macrospora]|uniref:Zn(2)-C6 fungal-type domain-containing protein n=1 Tax=Phialophora macrospora TaxID=1851006 RepID=A0A0D2CVV0_9EURO|nr:hypothetical protein PV04_05168 [Phialophora macrospora]